MRFAVLAFLGASTLFGGTAADLAKSVREIGFDPNQCYRVRDLTFEKEDIRIYLTEGHIIFSKPVAGRPIAALFTADGETGDAEVILLPPDRAERRALAAFTHAPNLDDHFTAAIFLFTGSAYQDLREGLNANPSNKKTPEIGALMNEQYGSVLRSLATSYQTRLAFDLLGHPGSPVDLFAGVFNSAKLGNYDVIYDPYNVEQIVAGQVIGKDSRVYFDDWTRFSDRSSRKQASAGKPPEPYLDIDAADYRIDAEIRADLSMSAVTRLKAKPRQGPLSAIRFEIAPEITITAASVDGQPAEVLQPESPLSNLGSHANGVFLVVPRQPLAAGREYEIEIHHEGKVILDAGDGVYYVAARGAWYPYHGLQFSTFDLTFHYPRAFQLVAPGDRVSDSADGDVRTTHWRTSSLIRTAAFNFGDFAHARVDRGPYSIDVYANRKLEAALQPRPQVVLNDPAPSRRRPLDPLAVAAPPPPQPNPTGRLQELAAQVASALDFMAARFGPPTLPHLAVSPIPGTFGQGFPGLIYLSTLSYVTNEPMGKTANLFYDDMLAAHEVAHQWWGNRVSVQSYRDNWLMEALANYSALLYLEKTKGARALDDTLEMYRAELLQKNDAGETKESAGPIVLGPRLQNSVQPAAWTAITYGKGSWIIHMLRRRMGDERFLALLSGLVTRYDHRNLTTEQFREEAAAALPPKSEDPKLEAFFDQWVYGTGIPALKFNYTLKGAAPNLKLSGTLTQSGVDDDFSALVPIEIRFAKGPSIMKWIDTGSEPATFSVALHQPPTKVVLDPKNAVLKH